MLTPSDLEKIKKITQEFFQKMTFEAEIEIGSPKDQTIPINLKVEEPQILIGERGQTLAEIQHLLKVMLRRKIAAREGPLRPRSEASEPRPGGREEPFYIDLDVNDYKKKKIEYLKELAKSIADEVAITKKEKELAPMPAYERRIIHLELAGRGDVVTESIGQEPERMVVIRSYP